MDKTIGQFEARVVDYAVSKTKKGHPMAMIRFKYETPEGAEAEINWYGTFASEKASEITMEALAVCGMNTNNPADLAKGAGSGILDEQRAVSITLKEETYDGKTRVKVAYVNPVGGAGFRDKMEHSEAIQMFNGMNLGGIAAAARKKHERKEVKNYAPGATAKFDENEPVPF